MGQIRYPLGTHSAHLSFLMPGETCNLIALPGLLEHLAAQAGEWGAFNLIGEVDERTHIFEALRRAGFSIYAWQRIWQFNSPIPQEGALQENGKAQPPALNKSAWRTPSSADGVAVRNLYQSLVPALVLPVEPVGNGRLQGLVYHQARRAAGLRQRDLWPDWDLGPAFLPSGNRKRTRAAAGASHRSTSSQWTPNLPVRTLLPGLAGIGPGRFQR